MIRFLLLLALPFMLHASKILSYNIYDRTDRVDVMITFDTPYMGVIKQALSSSKIIIKLENSSIESAKSKELSSKFLDALSITPMDGYTQIVADVPPTVILAASKTSDSYGLRLRFTKEVSVKEQVTPSLSEEPSLSALPTKQGSEMSQSYYIVVGVLILGILILFVLNKRISQNKTKPTYNSWLFKEPQEPQEKSEINTTNENVTIRFQKKLNEQNSVVMLDFASQSYLFVMGTNTVLLDKFVENKPVTQDDFETILQNRHQELDDFLRYEVKEEKEPLQIYKEKAASMSYGA